MNSFTISQLQDYSGIKAHTIRIWEQRYNALTPQRSKGNTRYYDGEQLRRLLNIVSLMNDDHKVSKLCALSDEELNSLLDTQYNSLRSATDTNDKAEIYISRLIAAALDFNEVNFEKIFSVCILRFGFRASYIQVIYPALQRLGLLWSKDALPPAHEHFIVNLIRIKIFTAIDALPPAKSDAASWLLFLPEDEFHEMGLLLAYFLIREAGHKVFYLGANVPLDSLEQTIDEIQPANILGFLVGKKNAGRGVQRLNELAQSNSKKKFYLACKAKLLPKSRQSMKLSIMHDVEQLDKLLA